MSRTQLPSEPDNFRNKISSQQFILANQQAQNPLVHSVAWRFFLRFLCGTDSKTVGWRVTQLYHCLMASLSSSGRAKISIWSTQYIVNGYPAGVLLLKVILREADVDTQATAAYICQRLASLDNYMHQVDSDIKKFNVHVKSLLRDLLRHRQTSDSTMIHLFEGYKAASDKTFVEYILRREEEYEDGQLITHARSTHDPGSQQIQDAYLQGNMERTLRVQNQDLGSRGKTSQSRKEIQEGKEDARFQQSAQGTDKPILHEGQSLQETILDDNPSNSGTLNGETVSEQSVTKTKYGQLEITWPAFNHDLIDALEDTPQNTQVCKKKKRTKKTACVRSPKHNKTKQVE